MSPEKAFTKEKTSLPNTWGPVLHLEIRPKIMMSLFMPDQASCVWKDKLYHTMRQNQPQIPLRKDSEQSFKEAQNVSGHSSLAGSAHW